MRDTYKRFSFDLRIEGCVGSAFYQAQYNIVAPHIEEGKLIKCKLAFDIRDKSLQLAMKSLQRMEAKNMTGEEISPEELLNTNRGYWAVSVPTSDHIYIPGLIPLQGEAYVPWDSNMLERCVTYEEAAFGNKRPKLVNDSTLAGKIASWCCDKI